MQIQRIPLRKGFLKELIMGLIFLFLFTSKAIGATYYVDPNGDDSNPGTQTKPWSHPQKCADTMVGGDSCIVKDGTYSDNNSDKHIVVKRTKFSGAGPNNWVTFQSENTHGALFDGENIDSGGRGFMLDGTAYVKILGFEIKRLYAGVRIQNGAHDIWMEDLKIHEIGRHWTDTACNNKAIRSYSGINGRYDTYNITVKNCNLYNIGRKHNQPEGSCWRDFLYDHSIYASGKGWLIENCEFRDAYSGWHLKIDGHDGASSNPTHIVRDCKFYSGSGGSAYKSSVFWGQILITKSHGVYMPHDIVIENCSFYEPEQNIAIRASDYIDLKGSIFRNNHTDANILYATGFGSPTVSNNTLNAKGLEPSTPTNLRIITGQ